MHLDLLSSMKCISFFFALYSEVQVLVFPCLWDVFLVCIDLNWGCVGALALGCVFFISTGLEKQCAMAKKWRLLLDGNIAFDNDG